jgi:phosphohistidine phosphatase SixA
VGVKYWNKIIQIFKYINSILFYMRHLFIARHGNYSSGDGGYRLNDSGRQQMEDLGKAIKEILNGGSARVISSTAPRAMDSSEVLIVQLALPEFEQVPYL